jgi:hypothetical protein
MDDKQQNYYTIEFYVDPKLNEGFTVAFRQGDEAWWWYIVDDESPAAGPVPDFTGARFKGLYQWTKPLLLT